MSDDFNSNNIPDCVELSAEPSPIQSSVNSRGDLLIRLTDAPEETFALRGLGNDSFEWSHAHNDQIWTGTVSGVTRQITILGVDGIDNISVTDVTLPRNLVISGGGDGHLDLILRNVSMPHTLRITGTPDADYVDIDNVSTANLSMNTGNGDDQLSFTDLSTARTTLYAGQGDDDVTFEQGVNNTALFINSTNINLGTGANTTLINGVTAINGINATSSSGNDSWTIANSIFQGPMNLSTTTGDDIIEITNSDFSNRATIRAGGNNDMILSDSNRFQSQTYFVCGGGDDSIVDNSSYTTPEGAVITACE